MGFLNSSAKTPSLFKGMETTSDQWGARVPKYKPPPSTEAVTLGSVREVLEETGAEGSQEEAMGRVGRVVNLRTFISHGRGN